MIPKQRRHVGRPPTKMWQSENCFFTDSSCPSSAKFKVSSRATARIMEQGIWGKMRQSQNGDHSAFQNDSTPSDHTSQRPVSLCAVGSSTAARLSQQEQRIRKMAHLEPGTARPATTGSRGRMHTLQPPGTSLPRECCGIPWQMHVQKQV